MAGKLIIDTIQTESSFLQLNVSTTRIATMNASGIFSNTGTKMIGYDGTIGVATIANTAIDGVITATQMAANSVNATILQTNSIENYFVDNSFSLGMRNRIINGDMRIAQRGTGAVTATSGFEYPVDRFFVIRDTATTARMTAQQDSSTPAGFVNSVKLTTTTAQAVLAATDYHRYAQQIEGLNVADLGWGTANAKTVTLSFWVRSSLTGTFGGSLGNSAWNRTYPFTYTISVADTWEYKTVTIPGDTSGTWLTTNGIGLRVDFGLGVGTTYSGTAGSWAEALYISATGATNVSGTLNATWYITGVQLEVGSVATPFERRPFGTELSLCQRYYYRLAIDNGSVFGAGYNQNTTLTRNVIPFPVTMRTKPTAVETTGTAGNYRVLHGTTVTACSAVPAFNSASVNNGEVQASVSSGLTAGQGNMLETNANGTYLGWSAEL